MPLIDSTVSLRQQGYALERGIAPASQSPGQCQGLTHLTTQITRKQAIGCCGDQEEDQCG